MRLNRGSNCPTIVLAHRRAVMRAELWVAGLPSGRLGASELFVSDRFEFQARFLT